MFLWLSKPMDDNIFNEKLQITYIIGISGVRHDAYRSKGCWMA